MINVAPQLHAYPHIHNRDFFQQSATLILQLLKEIVLRNYIIVTVIFFSCPQLKKICFSAAAFEQLCNRLFHNSKLQKFTTGLPPLSARLAFGFVVIRI
jgi:hypothetical protein